MFKKLKRLVEQSKPEYCHSDMIHLFLSLSYKSSFAYLAALSALAWLLYDFVPLGIFIVLISVHLVYQLIRFYLLYRYKGQEFSQEMVKKFRIQHAVLAFIGGSSWGIASCLTVIYAPSPYEYVVLALIVAMAAGSISTLSPVYRVYAAFNLPMLFFLMASFIYQGSEFHFYIAMLMPVFIFVVMSASWDMHKSLKRTIELKELFSRAQNELSDINLSLENKVAEQVERNRKQDQKMVEQSRLAQMGEMISMIAHQWRQPLSAITATTGTMSIKMELDDYDESFMQESIKKINIYAQYLSTTINDFRDFFKHDKEKGITSLNDVTLGSLHIIGGSLQSQGIIVETYLDAKIEFSSYPNELKQVLLNLLKNAQDILIENSIKEPKIMIKTINTDKSISLMICDNGGGISEENMKYIFDPYFTTKEKLDGTGLGLYMSKLIIEDHCKGHLSVVNADQGACFTIDLPLD